MANNHFVAGGSQVSDDQLVFRIPGVKEGFEVTGMLHAVGEGVADEGHVVAGLQAEWGRGRRMELRDAREDEQQERGEFAEFSKRALGP